MDEGAGGDCANGKGVMGGEAADGTAWIVGVEPLGCGEVGVGDIPVVCIVVSF